MMEVWSAGFNVKIMLSRATGSVSGGILWAFDINGNKAHKITIIIVGNATGDARLLILLPMEMR